ncbi:FAD-dependent monooxygenase [Pseudoalteromonas denitrificans]|uniref:2-octaprenylphenol hydroxylase n=1 Tax=Pseudoalteromonas denitrificans DSM 6059 TaxID=1123010 RepID=A0A1I1ULK0_9GAMM|nr:FAD-dependent monooxygenase [Pseudoalteromonas denitrificans]SFD71455.1 2-octaprenylphenol hydroxylase [Pseudoalteromonas denitrificans DSM 6059]
MMQAQVCIVGAGCIGLTLALGLAKAGIDVVVLDSASGDIEIAPEFGLRVSALSLASQSLFEKLGVWQDIIDTRAQSYQKMQVRDQDSFGKISFDATDFDTENLGHIVENDVIRQSLIKQLNNQPTATLMFETKYQQIHQSQNDVFLTLENGQPMIAKLLVACDGANSNIRQLFKMPITFWDYDHHAIVATIKTQLPHDNIARQVFLADGPLAFLPLAEKNTHSIVWSTSPDHAKKLLALSDIEFNKTLMAHFDGQCGLCEVVSDRAAFPLTMRYSKKWLDNRVVLMGDAAHTIHPLAGLGMNLGLKDAALLIDLLSKETDSVEAEFAPYKILREYERTRKSDAQTHIAMMQGLKGLFEGHNPVKKLIRGIGLNLVDNLSPLKQLFGKSALGK